MVDVRYNRGGHVSQLLIEKLARKRVGYDVSRWGKPDPYPSYSVAGPMVALTNQWAGSDGDIFSHVFKLMKLGPLIGKRTWGGVIGIWPRHVLADGSVTTQPEFSFWFVDVGWGVENYGTDPDIEVDDARRRTTPRAATRSSTERSPRSCACWRRTRPPCRRSTSARSSPRPRSSPDLPQSTDTAQSDTMRVYRSPRQAGRGVARMAHKVGLVEVRAVGDAQHFKLQIYQLSYLGGGDEVVRVRRARATRLSG